MTVEGGRIGQAISQLERLLAGCLRVLGPGHPKPWGRQAGLLAPLRCICERLVRAGPCRGFPYRGIRTARPSLRAGCSTRRSLPATTAPASAPWQQAAGISAWRATTPRSSARCSLSCPVSSGSCRWPTGERERRFGRSPRTSGRRRPRPPRRFPTARTPLSATTERCERSGRFCPATGNFRSRRISRPVDPESCAPRQSVPSPFRRRQGANVVGKGKAES